LGLLTCKNRLPYNLYCVGGDVKHCSLTHSRVNSDCDLVSFSARKALRRVWNLPLNTHIYFLFELSHALLVYDAVCKPILCWRRCKTMLNQSISQSIKRVLSFISKCVNSDCDLVSFSARHTVLYGSMSSPLGRSALCCSLRYMFDIECLLYPQFNNCSVVRNFYLSTRSAELLVKVDVLMMMMMIMN